jgi:hypothetical protein
VSQFVLITYYFIADYFDFHIIYLQNSEQLIKAVNAKIKLKVICPWLRDIANA